MISPRFLANNVQIENPHKTGEFMDVPPLQDAIVMNVGDLMMRWTNGRSYCSCCIRLPVDLLY